MKKLPEIDCEPGRIILYTGCVHASCEAEHSGGCNFCADHCGDAACTQHGFRCPKCLPAIPDADLDKLYIPDDYFADVACGACGLKCELYVAERSIFIREKPTVNRCPQCGGAIVRFCGDVQHTWEITGNSIVGCRDCEKPFLINEPECEAASGINDWKACARNSLN